MMSWPARLTLRILPLLAVAGCSHDPILYIPSTDRTMLQAQARLGNADDGGKGPISVDEMLRRAKQGDSGPAAASSVVLHFGGDTVQPDAAQRDTLWRFATKTGAETLVVSSRPGSFSDPATPVLGPRRAVAVSHELSAIVPNVQVRFEAALPPDVVVVSLGGLPARLPAGQAAP